jgi:hypothetical protein
MVPLLKKWPSEQQPDGGIYRKNDRPIAWINFQAKK